ncbi:MAG: alpha/beta fold hydrolase [Verrucomicrobiales bacterium]
MTERSKRWLKRTGITAAFCLGVGVGISVYLGQQLIAPAPSSVGPPPPELGACSFSFASKSGSTIGGWLSEVPDARGSVLLLHGIRSNRRSMADRALFLREAGYHTLCIDLQAHGESPGDHITLGFLESKDVAAGIAFLREHHPDLPVAVLGTSLGGGSALMVAPEAQADALIVESVFSNVETATANRLEIRFGKAGRLLAPLLTWQIRPTLGVDPAELSPLAAAARTSPPTFVICGSEDRHARPAESRAIYSATKGPKEFWAVEGAAHIDLHRFAGLAYERRVTEFLARHLPPPGESAR